MSQIIQIQDINSSDTIKTMVEKINYNFDQIMTFGGGPQGEKGDKGELGPDGEQGERGNLITVVDDISTVGSDLKVGDIAIYSDDQYIYEVKENSDNNLFFEKTSICIKGNKGERGEEGTSDSPFKYDEIQDAIITASYDDDEKIPSHTFIGTNTVISNGVGVLNVVGNKNANGIYLFTSDSDSNYCGKIYGDKLGSKNILAISGEDSPDNYVKIDNTLLTDKIHSSDNGIKIAEITTNNEIVLGDGSKNTSIECNELTVKNGSKTPIKTSSSRIDLKGNLYVNYEDYNYTTAIYGSINTQDSNLCVSTRIQANKDNGVIIKVSNNGDDSRYSSISISIEDGIQIDTNKVIIGKNSQSDTQINGKITATSSSHNLTFYYNELNIANVTSGNKLYVNYRGSTNPINEYIFCQGKGSGIIKNPQYSDITCANVHAAEYATAKVDGVTGVYLGCPIGTIVMWPNYQAPDGWLLCNGDRIDLYISGTKIGTKAQTIQGIDFATDDLYNLYTKIGPIFGGDMPSYILLPDLQQKFPLGALSGGTIGINNDDNRNGWSTTIGKTGGEEGHTLNAEILSNPAYFEYPLLKIENKGIAAGSYDVVTGLSSLTAQNAHNNIPPFLAINFIIKYK